MAKWTFFLLVVLGFSAMWQAADAQIVLNKPVLIGPPRSYLGSTENFFCKMDNISTSQIILYGLYNEDDPDKFIGEYSSQHKEEATFTLWITHDYDGKLICKASVQNNSEVLPVFSDPMVFEVVVPVDGVHIISSPFLKNLWEGDSLTLLCNISQGTYVLYSWFLNNTLLHNDSSNNQLTIPHLSSHDSGTYTCRTTQELNETYSRSIMSEGRKVSVKVPVHGVHIISSPFLKNLWEGDSLTLLCNISQGTYVLYSWFLNNTLLHNNSSNNQLTIPHLSSQDSGTYTCRATQELNETHSRSIMSEGRNVSVKVPVHGVHIISSPFLKNLWEGDSLTLLCNISQGTYVLYSWFLNNTLLHNDSSNNQLTIPHLSSQDSGTYTCRTTQELNETHSRSIMSEGRNVSVKESVGGTVTMKLEKFVRKNFEVSAVELSCHVERGTFPQYNWFLNNTRLESQGPFHRTFHANNSGLIVTLDPHNTNGGVYHCKVFNSFDSTTGVSSPATLISHEVFNKIPTEVAATVFTLFSLLIFALLACCIYGVVLRKRQARKYIFRVKDFTDIHGIGDDDSLEDEIQETEEEEHDNLDIEAYIEDQDILQATMIGDSDESEGEEETDFNNYNF